MHKSTYYLSILLSLFAIATATQGKRVLFMDDFESYTPDATLPRVNWGSITTGTDAVVEVVLDDDIPQKRADGLGISNQVLHVSDATSDDPTRLDANELNFQVATLSFYFDEPSGVDGTKFRLSFGGQSTSNTAFQITFNNGTLSDLNGNFSSKYSLDTWHRADVVVNSSAAAVDYNGSESVASLTFDIWIDGELMGDDIVVISDSTYTKGGSDMTAFRFTTDQSGLSQEVYIDNVFLYEGADINNAIP